MSLKLFADRADNHYEARALLSHRAEPHLINRAGTNSPS